MILLLGHACLLDLTPKNICKDFSSTGFHRLHENIYRDADFLPAAYTNRPLVEISSTRINHVTSSHTTTSDLEVIQRKLSTLILPAIICPHHKTEPRKETRKGRQKEDPEF